LRAPLAATESYIKYLMGCEPGTLNREQLELLNTALANLNRLEHFVTDMLDLARLDAGKMPYRVQPTSIRPAVEQVFRLFKFNAQERGVRLCDDLPCELPAILADPDKLSRILTNLLSNAIKFTDQGGRIRVLASRLPRELMITVADSGIGMSPGTLDRLFQRFSEPLGVLGRPRGAGLGLWIVKSLVEGQGGRVWAESQPGVGSRFHFTVPLA
jgi:signal transduction histidine kinase